MYQAWIRPGIYESESVTDAFTKVCAEPTEVGTVFGIMVVTYKSQDTEKDIYNGVGRADASLNPDCEVVRLVSMAFD